MIAPIIRVSTYIHLIDNTLERFNIFDKSITNSLEMYSKSEIELLGCSSNDMTNQLAYRFLRNGFSGGESIEPIIGLYFRLNTIREKLEKISPNHFVLMHDKKGKAFNNPLDFLFFGLEFNVNSCINLTHISPGPVDCKENGRVTKGMF